MTISSTARRSSELACNGATTSFAFTFKVQDESYLSVYLKDSSGDYTLLALTTNYSVTLNADQDTNPGGSITTVSTYASGNSILIISQGTQLQTMDLQNLGGFFPNVINEAVDRNTIATLDMREIVDRSFRLPITSAAKNEIDVTDGEASVFLALDASGNPETLSVANAKTLLDYDLTDLITDSDGIAEGSTNLFLTAAERAAIVANTAKISGDNVEGSTVKSTGEAGGTKFLREDGDGTSSWQDIPPSAPEGVNVLSTGEGGGSKFLREDGDGTCSWVAIPGGGDALIASPLSQFAATTSLQLKGVISDETGAGALVFAESPTLVTPDLGTPSALVGTNITGTAAGLTAGTVTTNANLTGAITSSGNATSLGSFTIAQLNAAISNATLSGSNTGDQTLGSLGAAASGANTDITSLRQSVNIVDSGTAGVSDLGFRGLPSGTTSGTMVLGDAGKRVVVTANVTIPSNASVNYPNGTVITVINNSSSTKTLSINSDTLRLAGTTTTGTRTMAPYSVNTIVKIASTTWIAAGVGMT